MQSLITWASTAGENSLLAAAVDTILKSSVLLILATTIALLLGRASAAVRHRLWCLTFAGLLLLPALSYALPAWRIPVLPPVEGATLPELVAVEPTPPAMPGESPAFVEVTPSTPGDFPGGAMEDWEQGMQPGIGMQLDFPPEQLAVEVTDEGEPQTAVVVETPVPAPTITAPQLLLAAWLTGTTIVLLPLILGLAHSLWLGLRADRITDPTWTGLLDELRDRLQLRRRVALLELRRPVIPMTWGVLRPVVIVPEAAHRWPERLRRFVLLHELAHVKRWDVPFQLLGRFACAVYWFHPLSWYALRRLRVERELACDDCVVTTGERPSDYAEQLLQIVRTCRPAGLASVGVAMARTSHLEGRIRAMFDNARSHVPLSARAARVLTIAAALLVTTVAVVRPAAREAEPVYEVGREVDVADTEAAGIATADDESPSTADEARNSPSEIEPATTDSQSSPNSTKADAVEEWQIFRGTIVDTADQPIANATIHTVYIQRPPYYAAPATTRVVSTQAASPTGEFELELPKLPAGAATDGSVWFEAVATAPGYGFAALGSNGRNAPQKVQLPPAQSIRGRIVDLEGVPVSGATLRVFNVALAASDANIDLWLEETRKAPPFTKDQNMIGDPPGVEKTRFPGLPNTQFATDFFPTLTTDEDGRFQLDGIGRDHVAVLVLTGPGLAQSLMQVLARPLDKPLNSQFVGHLGGPNIMYGADFTFVAGPSAPVRGVARDLDTHAPIAGATVMSNALAGTTMSQEGFIRATTDADGRYELLGLPFGKGNSLSIAPGDQPYLNTGWINLPEMRDLQPIVRDIELPKAIWATGRLFDITTGEPVQGTLHYSPFRDNTFAERYPQYADQTIYFLGADRDFRTDSDGRFRIPVIPGHGVLCAKANNRHYRTGYGVEKIEELAPLLNDVNGNFPTFDHVAPAVFHSLREINPGADVTEIGIEMPVDPGVSLELLFTDAAGQPVTGVTVGGVSTSDGRATTTDRATALGLTEGTAVTVVAQQLERKLGARIDITPTPNYGPQTIVLHPPVITRGRLIDPQDAPITDTVIEVRCVQANGFSNQLGDFNIDAGGNFTLELLAGETYQLLARGEKYNVLANDLVAKPNESIDLGDLVIDPQGKQWEAAVPKRAPIITKSPVAAAAPAESTTATATPTPAPQPSNAPGEVVEAVEIRVQQAADEPIATAAQPSYSGQVADTAGRPLAGAKIWLAIYTEEAPDERHLRTVATSDRNGKFQFELAPETRSLVEDAASHWSASLIAQAPGYGLDALFLDIFADQSSSTPARDEFRAHIEKAIGKERFAQRALVLRTSPRPVRGRLLDLEGRPLSNVTLRLEAIGQPNVPLLLKAFEEKSKDRYYEAINTAGSTGSISRPHLDRLLTSSTTDADGRFEFAGIGDDQVATLSINGDGIQAQLINVLGRSMAPSQIPHIDFYPNGAKDVFFGWDFTHAVGPSIPVIGVVKDVDTGEPVANTYVRVERLFSEGGGAAEGQLRLDTSHLHTVTDAQGRFRLDGMPPGIGHVLEATPPKDQPFLMASHSVTLSLSDAPAKEVTIQVKKTLWIEGRVTDKQTGAPVAAYVDYLALETNPHTLDKHGLRQGWQMHRYRTASDGRYRVPGLPGQGLAMVLAISDRRYPRAIGAESVAGYDKDRQYIPTNPVGFPLSNWNLIKPIDPAPGAESFNVDFELDAGQEVAGRVVGPDGAAVSDFSVIGEVVNDVFWKRHSDGGFTLRGYDGQGPRQVFVKSADESLIGQARLEGSSQELLVTLEPAVRVTGRLIEHQSSLPAERYYLYCASSSLDSFRIDDNCQTGDDGRFEIKGLLAGLTYEIHTSNPQHFSSGKNNFSIDLTQAKPGDVVDIGDVPNQEPENAPAKPAAMMKPKSGHIELAASTTTATSLHKDEEQPAITIRGTVVDAAGHPVPGAFVAAGATSFLSNEPVPGDVVFGQATSAADGQFEIQVIGASSKSHTYPKVYARTNESAIAWAVFDLDHGSEDVTLTLQPQHLIEGQLVDLDGQPASGVVVEPQGVIVPVSENPGAGLRCNSAARAALPTFTTDAAGRFAIRNVAAGHGVYLQVIGDDRFAPQDISLNTGADETRGEFDGTYRPYTKNLKPGEQAIIPLAPAQLFEGVVLLGDTSQPAANARISIWASQQEFGSMTTVEGRTDADGRFKLNPNPGIKFGIQAYAPDGVPYLVKQLRDLRWSSGEAARAMQIRLPQGVLVTGTVTDAASGAPVSKAYVQYYPDQAHNPNVNDDLIVRWQGAERTNDNGEFQIAVPAGPGTLLIHAESPVYILEERGSLELDRGQAGGNRTYAHAFAKIDPVAAEPAAPLEIKLTTGATVSGNLVDSDGKPIEAAKMISRLKVVWHSPQWRGFSDDVAKGRFEISGLGEGHKYPVYFVDIERGLGAMAWISADNPNPTIVLQRCGSAKAKFVNQDGEPIDGRRIGLYMVVTPGPSTFNGLASRLGLLAADEDFYSNMTRIFNWNTDKPENHVEASFDLLIPGATYRIPRNNDGPLAGPVDFTVESGETRDLGTIELEMSK